MAITPHPLTIVAQNFNEALYKFLAKVEGDIPFVYDDGKGIPTLGIGYALVVYNKATGQWVLRDGYLTDLSTAGKSLTPVQQTDLGTKLTQAMKALNGDATATNPFSPYYPESQRQNVLDWTIDSTQSKNLFNYVRPEYETRVRNWLGNDTVYNSLQGSMEMVALFSLAYQGFINTGSSPALKRAILNNDRAEAWYEIRYNTSVEARRFLEADTFGLYNDATANNDEDAKGAYRMLTRHRTKILGADGLIGTADDYEQVNQSRLNTAVTWGNSLGIPVQTLAANLQPAREYLYYNYYAYGTGLTLLNGDILIGEDATTSYYRNTDRDTLIGTHQNDLIFGESGDDYLDSKGGSDVLYGGLGDDTYIIDGRDPTARNDGSWIEDKQGHNTVVMNGVSLKFFIKENGQIAFYAPDKRFTGQYQGTDFVVRDTQVGNSVILNENFADGDFGIRLVDRTADPDTTFEWPVLDPDAGLPDAQRAAPNWDGLRNGTAYSDTANGPDASVVLATYVRSNSDGTTSTTEVHPGPISGTADAEVIHGLGGDDWIDGYGGADRLYGDSGKDVIYFYPSDPVGNALADGGAGRDVILGWSAGNNHLIGGANDDAGDEADLIISAGGNDTLEGGQGNDLLFDYLGQDFLDGGLGDDFLFGNATVGFIDTTTWSIGPVLDVINGVQHTGDSYTFPAPQLTGISNINYAPTSDNQGDVLLGGAGNDYLTAGPGDDFLDAGAKDDTGANTNVLYAGLGNDTLIGGADHNLIVEHNVTYRWLTRRIRRQHGMMKLAA